MKWLKRIVTALGAVVAILAVIPFFVTLNDYIPALEKEISAKIGEPVSIESLRASVLPTPHVTIGGLGIGAAGDIKVGKVVLKPDLWSLTRHEKVIRSVDVEDVALNDKALGVLAALAQSDRAAGNIRVEHIVLRNAVVKMEQASFGPFDVDVRVRTGSTPGLLTLETRDGALKARATPEGERFLFDITARAWAPPLGPPVRFDELVIKGVARAKDADLSDIQAKLYGGTVTGKLTIEWANGIGIKGNLDVKQVELRHAAALFAHKTKVSGQIDAKPVFSAHAASAAQLQDALRLETSFTVHQGTLHGFDLVSAATTLGKSTGGGDTRFDELAGRLAMEGRTYRFTDLRIASGAIAARGNVSISPSKALSGRLNANVKALGRSAAIPLVVAGSLDAPTAYPDPTALVGAAAGTVLMGPGAGTAAGAKLGEFVEGLMGSRKR
jgi:uncharacterized protein involved in outer membrane biogenesis